MLSSSVTTNVIIPRIAGQFQFMLVFCEALSIRDQSESRLINKVGAVFGSIQGDFLNSKTKTSTRKRRCCTDRIVPGVVVNSAMQ